MCQAKWCLRPGTSPNSHIHDVSLKVRKGEVLGIGGLIGAGRTELLRALFGIDEYQGEVFYNDRPICNRSPQDAIQRGFAFVPEDRKDLGLILSPFDQGQYPHVHHRSYFKTWLYQAKQGARDPGSLYTRAQYQDAQRPTQGGALSGGNQQKVVLGKALASEPSVILLDEPTRGVDVGAKAEIYRIINDLTCKGFAVIMVSSELPELIAMSDRILVMHEGCVSGELEAREATEEAIMHMAI